ncbi:MAG TPA: 50S ribosomal protein L18 [Nitrospiria bacterium]|nr:50S ribosomal protein L18 [Nitrospiria bacterium]
MGTQQASREAARVKRHRRVRQKIAGRMDRPRLTVFRSHKHIYAQVVDDTTGRTLASASTLDPAFRSRQQKGSNRSAATTVGQLLAERALAAKVQRVVFDRGGYLFHGRVKALADGARSAGLEF